MENKKVLRPLQVYESLLFASNVVCMLEIEHPKITPELVSKALLLERYEHPFLRVVLSSSSAEFEENWNQNYEVEFEIANLSEWKNNLINWAAKPRDHTKSFIYTKMISDEDKKKHQIYFVLNHSASDGPGTILVAESFLKYLSLLIDNDGNVEAIPKPTSRPFVDIQTRYDLKKASEQPMPSISNYIPAPPGDQNLQVQSPFNPIGSVQSELDESTTSNLLSQCRKHGSTIQAALSTSGMMIAIYAQKDKYPLPQTICNQAPINMRKYVEPPLDASDIVCGSAALWWPQKVQLDDKLWKLVVDATASIKKDIEEKTPLAWWARFAEGKFGEIRPFTIMTTSMGVTSIQPNYNSLKVNAFKLMGAKYETPEDARAVAGGLMTHVHTTFNRLNTSFSYSSKFFSRELAEKLASIQQKVLQVLSDPNQEEITVREFLDQIAK